MNRKTLPLAISALLAISVVAIAFMGSTPAAAESGPKIVIGFVYDSSGNPIEGAQITAVVINMTTSLETANETDTTGSEGAYSVTFDPFAWGQGDTLRVTANYNSVEQSNQTRANEDPFQQVDVHFPTVIPQFGSILGFGIAAGLLCVVGVAFTLYRRKP